MATIINGDGIVTAEGTSTTQGRLRLGEDTDNGSNYVELQAPASVASNLTFTLPSADGTNGQVIQTNGSGVLSFATPASGALVYVTSVTANNSASVDLDDAMTTYNTYMVVADQIVTTFDATPAFRARLKIGGSYRTDAGYYYHSSNPNSTSTTYSAVAAGSETYIAMSFGLAVGGPVSFVMYINRPSDTTTIKAISWIGAAGSSASGTYAPINGAGTYANLYSALTGIRFYTATNNLVSGTFRLYGIANS